MNDQRPGSAWPRGLQPLAYKNYALYWIGWVVSNTGRWIELTGSLWLVYELTDSPLLLGLMGLFRAIPAVVLSPIAGVVADRFDQRRLIQLTQSLSLAGTAVLGMLVLTGSIEVWHIYVQVALQSAFQAFDMAARQALFPRLVPRELLPEAVTLGISAGRLSKLVGPALGGFAIAAFGVAAPYLLNAASFLVLIVAVSSIRGIAPPVRTGLSFRSELRDGVQYLLRVPVMRAMLNLEIVFSIFSMNEAMITILGREVLGVGPEGLGILLSAPALGSLVGVVLAIRVGLPARPGRMIVLCLVTYSGVVAATGLMATFEVLLVALAITGFLDAVATITRHSIMQLAAPPDMRGRLMANMGTITVGLAPLSNTVSGSLSSVVGPPGALITSGAAMALAAIYASRPTRPLWHFSRDDAAPGPVSTPMTLQ